MTQDGCTNTERIICLTKVTYYDMVELPFIVNFIAESAFAFVFVPFFLGMMPPIHSKSIFKGLFGMIFLFLFFARKFSFNFFIDTSIFIVFIIYGIMVLVPMIKYKGKMYAIEEYQKKPQKPKYGLNDTIKRINNFIYVALLACLFLLISVFVGAKDITTLFGIIFLLSILVIMGNHFMNGHIKDTTNIDPKKIKVNLLTLMSLTLMLSLMILFVLLFNVSKYFPTLLDSFPFIAFLVAVPPLYISNYLLERSRLTFFRDRDVAKIFISNILHYSIISVVIIIILSDIPVALSVLKGQNVSKMIYWVIGFVFFITQALTIILKKSLLFGLESKIINLSTLKSLASE
ncbi:MAG: hypothetical protein PHD13_06475 [Methanocellales archaeon]|nr:hypothetical protein [Methanocellales archaeon]MDD3291309.1 hypothetical protein [Methanocellales archaeon]MDD5235803.1 hypothetical protein [Methanocellales archaeon]MDD5484436.1 hypothetical protein [Methanocellales archaeon]